MSGPRHDPRLIEEVADLEPVGRDQRGPRLDLVLEWDVLELSHAPRLRPGLDVLAEQEDAAATLADRRGKSTYRLR